jgi:hypothetical protein
VRTIRIGPPEHDRDDRIVTTLQVSPNIAKYFLTDQVTYACDAGLSDVAPSILQIPTVASVIHVAWAIGADVHVDTLDATYLASLRHLQKTMRAWYPWFSNQGTLAVHTPDANAFAHDGAGLLFTGGLDSLTSYINNRAKAPHLITVTSLNSRPFYLPPGYDVIERRLGAFTAREQVRQHVVKSNFESVINKPLLNEQFSVEWWMHVCHAIYLTGLCAPITATENIGTIIHASTFDRYYNPPWGHHPELSKLSRWADVHVVHDSWPLTRQEKIKHLLKRYIEDTGTHPTINMTDLENTIDYDHIGKHEKQLLTITGLVLEGIDPNKCGFHDIDAQTFRRLKQGILDGQIMTRPSYPVRGVYAHKFWAIRWWLDIQRHIPPRIDTDLCGSKAFLEWLRTYDIRRHVTHTRHHDLPRLLRSAFLAFCQPYNAHLPTPVRRTIRRLVARTTSR